MKSYPIVMIEWEDSSQAYSPWQWLDKMETPGVVKCSSVGFMVRKNKKETALAISLANADQVSGIISIPTRCIIKIKRLI